MFSLQFIALPAPALGHEERRLTGPDTDTKAAFKYYIACAQGGGAMQTRYPELRGRGPHIADMSPLSWGVTSAEQLGEPEDAGGRQQRDSATSPVPLDF